MKNLISLIIITILCFSFGSCERIKNKNVIYEDLYFTVLKLDNGQVIILPKDNNSKSEPVVVNENDYKRYKYNININK